MNSLCVPLALSSPSHGHRSAIPAMSKRAAFLNNYDNPAKEIDVYMIYCLRSGKGKDTKAMYRGVGEKRVGRPNS